MVNPVLSVREIQANDIDLIIHYWLSADENFLRKMGADPAKVPTREQWNQALTEQLNHSYQEKKSYCTIWTVDGKPVGHCNVNKIAFGKEAHMHLHLWNADTRTKGMGTMLVKLSLPYFFEKLQLKHLYCEPHALNAAPNKTLAKTGFEFVKEYTTTPGMINFEQPVKQWHLSLDRFKQLI